MWARVARFRLPKDRIDEDIAETRKLVTEAVKTFPGAAGAYYLVDRERGEALAVTLWESEKAMRDSEEATARMRQEGADRMGETILGIERFEVVLEPSDVLTSV